MNKLRAPILLILSFLLPMTLMLLVLRVMGFYPFGDKSLLIMDMAGQVLPVNEHLKYIASGDAGIFFSWSKSYGTNFTGVFAFYLSSPLSLIMLPFEDPQLGIFWLTVITVSLCAASSFFYFRYVKKCKDAAVLLFTTSYALMSYNIAYSLSPMWLSAVIMLPLVLLGAEKILRGERPWVFIITLGMMLIFNYYTGYMVCLFALLYCICRYFSVPADKRSLGIPRALGIFAASYAAALGLAAWLLLPVYFDLSAGKIGYMGYVPPGLSNFPLREFIQAVLPRNYTSITTHGVPMLYTGFLTAFLCLYYFISRKITLRAKLMTGTLFLILLCSFFFIKTEIVWHIFKYPNWFPSRYSFVFQFLAVSAACDGYMAMKSTGNYAAVPQKLKKLLPFALLFPVCLDMGTNASALFKGLDRQFGYKSAALHADFIAETQPIIDEIHAADDGFYRIEKTYIHSLNDALSLGYNGIAHYSSMFSREVLDMTKQMGMAQTYFWNGYIGSTPATDALFGVKYVLSRTSLPYEILFSQGDVAVYQNPYVLPVAFVTDGLPQVPARSHDCFAVQNETYRQLAGYEPFIPIDEVEKHATGYTVTSNGMPMYAYFPTYRYTAESLYVNGELRVPRYLSADDNNAVYIGTYPAGTQVTISFDTPDAAAGLLGEYIYALDVQALADATDFLRSGGLTDISYTATSLRGTYRAQSDSYLFISIPYDAGWTVRVGGEAVEVQPALGAFMAVPLPSGEHTVEMAFRPAGLTAGIAISAVAILGLIVWHIRKPYESRLVAKTP